MSQLTVHLRETLDDAVPALDSETLVYKIPEGSFSSLTRVVDKAIQMAISSIALSLGAKRDVPPVSPHVDSITAPEPGTVFETVDSLESPTGFFDRVKYVESDEDGIFEIVSKFNQRIFIKHDGQRWIQILL